MGVFNKFTIVDNFSSGYKDKRDIVKEEPGVAVSGSQNVITVDGEKIGIRPGYSLFGAANAATTPILGGGNWKTHRGLEIPWRSYNDELEFYYSGSWRRLDNGFGANVAFRSSTWWDTSAQQDLLILVNGTSTMYSWTGGITTFDSAAAGPNTITKEGTTSWLEEGFSSTGSIVIDGTTYTYSGGASSTILTGVSPDPTLAGHATGAVVHQDLVTSSNTPASGFDNDFVATINNQLYVFDRNSREVYVSRTTSYTTYTFSSPRLPGEGALLTLDETPTAAIELDEQMAISTRNQWYITQFKVSDDNTTESIFIKLLKASPLEGASNDLAVTRMKNYIISVSNEPTIDTLGNVENIDTPQNLSLSDPIKNTMDVYAVDEATAFYHKNNLYLGLKASSSNASNNRILVRNLATGAWETPWTIPAGIIFEYAGDLYVHSSVQAETYKLLDTYEDNSKPLSARWYSSYENYNTPYNQKYFTKMWIDGYIRSGTVLDIYLSYDFGTSVKKVTFKGTQSNVVYRLPEGASLGEFSLGTRNLGGTGELLNETGLLRFRGFIILPKKNFYEIQTSFQSDGLDYRWEIVSYGFNVQQVEAQDNTRKIN